MKTRIISAVVASIIFIPIFIIGGLTFNIAFYILTLLALREFMKVREKEHKYPDFIRLMAYLVISILYFQCTLSGTIDYKILSAVALLICLPVVLYHDEKVYNIEDVFYLMGGIFFLGFAMSLFYSYRQIDIKLIVFLLLITIITDSYAYFIGRLIGKNKLLESVSPKKTWEGTIGGSLVCAFICTVYYITAINPAASIYAVSIITLFLSLIGQFGDLFFSAIKRRYGVKDFSNIMPGHGGVLDRLDSIIFVLLAFTFLINLI